MPGGNSKHSCRLVCIVLPANYHYHTETAFVSCEFWLYLHAQIGGFQFVCGCQFWVFSFYVLRFWYNNVQCRDTRIVFSVKEEKVNENERLFFFHYIIHTSDHTGSIVQRLVVERNCLTLSCYTVGLTL